MYKVGDFCKHYKGKSLDEKNIYRIIATNVKYSGDSCEQPLENMVVYENIFQGKFFCREEKDLSAELSTEKQVEFGQKHRVDVLTPEEVEYVMKKLEKLKTTLDVER